MLQNVRPLGPTVPAAAGNGPASASTAQHAQTAEASDTVTIRSPFSIGGCCSAASASAPRLPAVVEEAASHGLDPVHRWLLAGLGGIALLGALGLGGCAAPPPAAHASSAMPGDSLGVQTLRGERRTSPTASPQAGQAALGAEEGAAQSPAAQPRPIKVLGQQIGVTSDGVEHIEWKTYTTTHKGNTVEIAYPKGWKVARTQYGVAVVDPQRPETYVAFQWRDGSGNISAKDLLSTVLREGDIHDVRVNAQQSKVESTQNGPMESLLSDLSYTVDGVPVRGQFLTGVTNMSGYISIHSSYLTATQTREQDFAKDQPVLLYIGNSLSLK